MYSLIAKITIAGNPYREVGSVKIKTSIDDHMDTATLIMPQIYRKDIKKNDEVIIELGYEEYGLNAEFYGKVTEVSPQSPNEIHCADLFYDLRQKYVTGQIRYSQKTIYEILRHILRGTVAEDAIISRVAKLRRIDFTACHFTSLGKPFNMTIRAAVQKLANDHGFLAYFSRKKLYFIHHSEAVIAGDAYPEYAEGVNIIESNLQFGAGNVVKKVTVCSEHKVGSYVQASHYLLKGLAYKNAPGEERVYYVDGLGDGNACYSRAKELFIQLNSGGYNGNFKTFGHPYVRAGQYCSIKMKDEKPTVQTIRQTEVTFDTSGFRRDIIPVPVPQAIVDINQIINQVTARFKPTRAAS